MPSYLAVQGKLVLVLWHDDNDFRGKLTDITTRNLVVIYKTRRLM